LETINSLK